MWAHVPVFDMLDLVYITEKGYLIVFNNNDWINLL